MNIFLIGYRGTGKSAVGRGLATILKRPWLDMDEELTHRLGTTLQAYVGRWGWPSFRREEKSLLQEVCRRNGWVVSTGGGVVLDADNVTAMRGCGRVIWLQASPGAIQERLAADPRTRDMRPPLSAASDPATEIQDVLGHRLSLYRQAAHWQIDTEGLAAEKVCRRIAEWLASSSP
ncbi:MAG: shikimate kinase [Hyphomicrobiales bacterium]